MKIRENARSPVVVVVVDLINRVPNFIFFSGTGVTPELGPAVVMVYGMVY